MHIRPTGFQQCRKVIQLGTDNLFKECQNNCLSICGKMNLDLYITLQEENYVDRDHRTKIKAKILKHLEKNVENIHELELDKDLQFEAQTIN